VLEDEADECLLESGCSEAKPSSWILLASCEAESMT